MAAEFNEPARWSQRGGTGFRRGLLGGRDLQGEELTMHGVRSWSH